MKKTIARHIKYRTKSKQRKVAEKTHYIDEKRQRRMRVSLAKISMENRDE